MSEENNSTIDATDPHASGEMDSTIDCCPSFCPLVPTPRSTAGVNLFANPTFEFDSVNNSFLPWGFVSFGNYPGARQDPVMTLVPVADGWGKVTDVVVAREHTFIKSDPVKGILVKTTLPMNIANSKQYVSRVQQVVPTVPNTIYTVKFPFALTENVGIMKPRYAASVRADSFTGTIIASKNWANVPATPTAVSITFTALTSQTCLNFTLDNTGLGNVGNYFVVQVYNPIVSSTVIQTTVHGISHRGLPDAQTLFEYVLQNDNSNIADSATAFNIPNFRLATGQPQSVAFTPTADQTIVFDYVPSLVNVRVLAFLENSARFVPGYIPIRVQAEANSQFWIDPPIIPGYRNVAPLPAVVTVAENGTSALVFYYTPNTSAQQITAVDERTNYIIGTKQVNLVAGQTYDATDANAPTAADIPMLAHYTLVAGSGTPAQMTFDGTDCLPTMNYRYTRNVADVELVAYDITTSDTISGEIPVLIPALEVLRPYNYGSDRAAFAGYTVTAISDTVVLVPESGVASVPVYYTQSLPNHIEVQIRQDNGTGVIIQNYALFALTGASVTAIVPTLYNFQFDSSSPDNVLATVNDGTNKLVIIMKNLYPVIPLPPGTPFVFSDSSCAPIPTERRCCRCRIRR